MIDNLVGKKKRKDICVHDAMKYGEQGLFYLVMFLLPLHCHLDMDNI